MIGGHYYAYAYNTVKKGWYELNDSSTSEIRNIKDIVSSGAYILFYKRNLHINE